MAISAALVPLLVSLTMATECGDEMAKLADEIQMLSRQMMMQQFYVEEIARTDSNSGLKRVRIGSFGQRPYQSASYVDTDIAAIHDHANHIRTVGLGEMVVVMNGVEFRTRHNDYMLKKKRSDSKKFKATEDIEFPEVPPEVLEKKTLKGQVEEMKEWFKAWKEEDDSKRDYKKYFKPVLCYMEGFWMTTDMNKIAEPFFSDRHFIDARTWLDLQDMARFYSYSGSLMTSENFSYLPTSVMYMRDNGTRPVLAQWVYRILCQPLKEYVSTRTLHPALDVKSRVAFRINEAEYERSMLARFYLSDEADSDRRVARTLLDDLMEQIPGLDNDQADLTDDVYGEKSYRYTTSGKVRLNTGYYHRVYRVATSGPFKLKLRHRSFADEDMFVAQNTQSKVPELELAKCNRRRTSCARWRQRWSYAIPLEVVYMTPLATWNPHGIAYRGNSWTREGQRIYAGADGRRTRHGRVDAPFDGINSNHFFLTPYEFYENANSPPPPSPASKVVYVLDRHGQGRPVRASGVYVNLPEIPGVGLVRQRYPIMPLHGEGSSVWKELSALQDLVLNPERYDDVFPAPGRSLSGAVYMPWTSPAYPLYELHQHRVIVDEGELRAAARSTHGGHWLVEVLTEEAMGHQHLIKLTCDYGSQQLVMWSCDGRPEGRPCGDGHAELEGSDIGEMCTLKEL